MREYKNKYLGWLAGVWLLIGRPGPLLLAACVLLAGWLVFVLYSGAKPSRQELAAIRCAYELKSLTDLYVTDYGAPAAAFTDIISAYPDSALPVNPYTGQPCAELNPGDELKPGDFSYLLLIWHDRIENSAVLVYSAAPQTKQCFYNRWFHKHKQPSEPDLAAGKMEVVWIGGATDTHYAYLSRGLDPERAINKLRLKFQPASAPGEMPDANSLEVLTAAEYAQRLELQP